MTNQIGPAVNDRSLLADASDPMPASPVTRPTGAVAAIARAVATGTGLITDLVDRIVNRIRAVAPAALGLGLGLGLGGCQSTEEPAAVAPPAVEALPPAKLVPSETGPHQLGTFTITFYYVIGEDEVATKPAMLALNDNRAGANAAASAGSPGPGPGPGDDGTELAAMTSDQVTLYGGNKCEPIAEVSKEFASQLALQGTGKLHDGRVLNISGPCNCHHSPCFHVTQAQWGTAGSGKSLQPFRTVAVDPKVVKLGSLLYVPLLEGRTMPGRPPWGGYVHDGCVIADDTGGHIAGNRIDLFVGRKAYFLGLSGSGGSHAWARHVPVFDGAGICERKGRKVGKKSASI
jgi:3D (Asp-Asp-Asp) domain-containing protein